jgi:alpha-galactosidase
VLRTNREGSPVLDPTIDDVREKVRSDIRRLVTEWGFELVKHDFTSFDIFDLWGNEMGREVAQGNWRFAHAGLTNAEVVRRLYEDIREAADDAVIIGCNTVGHLSVGLFELQRIGDDTSGRAWERTRRMGVNTLAFRAAQHNAFFAADADCVGMTSRIPWELNEQWLDLVSRSGTPLFVSPCVSEVTGPRRSVLREAFERASRPRPVGEPLDWLDNSTPTDWRFADGEAHYRWNDGAAAEFRLRPKE